MSAQKILFTSDLHLDHIGLMKFRNEVHNKSWVDVGDVDQWLVNNWNSMVNPKDIVWILGDVAWTKAGLDWLNYMNGTKNLVLGNHDCEGRGLKIEDYKPYFNSIHGALKKYEMIMTHVPIHPNELCFRWEVNLHGHIHHKGRNIQDPRYINVNTDTRGGYPVTLDDIRKEMDAIKTGHPQKI